MKALTIPQVAEALQVSVRTARELTRSGAIPTVKVGPRLLRVRQETLDAYLVERESA